MNLIPRNNDHFLIYKTQDGKIRLDVCMMEDTVWLSQDQMSILFGRDQSVISRHIKNVFDEGELERESNMQILHITDIPRPFMGMTSYDKSVPKRITKSDATTAKNYLTKEEIEDLGLLVEQFLAFAELQARRQVPMYMKDWIERLDAILQMNGRELLTHAGKIRHAIAEEIAEKQLEVFRDRLVEEERIMSINELEYDIQQVNEF